MANVNTGCRSKKRGLGNSNAFESYGPNWTEELQERKELEHRERVDREHQELMAGEHQELMARIVKTAIQNKTEPLDFWTRELKERKEREHQERVARIVKTAMQKKPLPLDEWNQQKREMGFVEKELGKMHRPFHFHSHGDE